MYLLHIYEIDNLISVHREKLKLGLLH
jgi:hypothetical protein